MKALFILSFLFTLNMYANNDIKNVENKITEYNKKYCTGNKNMGFCLLLNTIEERCFKRSCINRDICIKKELEIALKYIKD